MRHPFAVGETGVQEVDAANGPVAISYMTMAWDSSPSAAVIVTPCPSRANSPIAASTGPAP